MMQYETLKTIATPFLLGIKGKMTETFGLSVLDEKQGKNLVLYSIRGPDYSCFNITPLTRTPLHTSAPGKALVAFLPEKQREEILARLTFEKLTDNTITDRPTYEKRLALVRERGYAVDMAEELPYCHCGGVPILDPEENSVAALWLSGVNTRLPPGALLENIRILSETARRIEGKLTLYLLEKKGNSHLSPCVAAALRIVNERVGETIDYPTLALDCHVSYSTLRTFFHKEVGITLGRYHMNLRIKKVQDLLTETDLSVTEIARSLGFYDQKRLSALFKRETGISPLQYRKRTAIPPPAGETAFPFQKG